MENAWVTAFTVSELLRENKQLRATCYAKTGLY